MFLLYVAFHDGSLVGAHCAGSVHTTHWTGSPATGTVLSVLGVVTRAQVEASPEELWLQVEASLTHGRVWAVPTLPSSAGPASPCHLSPGLAFEAVLPHSSHLCSGSTHTNPKLRGLSGVLLTQRDFWEPLLNELCLPPPPPPAFPTSRSLAVHVGGLGLGRSENECQLWY